MIISAAIYARASPDCPATADQQVEHLRTIATEHGWTVVGVFIDHPMTVKKGRERRPGETALRDAIRHGDVQKVLISSIDRIGRTLEELVRFLEICRDGGVSLWLDDQMLDTAQSKGLDDLRHRRHDGASISVRAGVLEFCKGRRQHEICRCDLAVRQSRCRDWKRPRRSWRPANPCGKSRGWLEFRRLRWAD